MNDLELKEKAREAADEKMINDAFQELMECYLASTHRKKVDLVTKAFNFARQAHSGVRRLSGEPYIMHPISVALIACKEMGLGSTSICAALLHDVVEDTEYTVEDIENIFGTRIAMIVEGLTKISGGIFGEKASAQAENFKKLLLTMSNDIRVILIKICDRLHNMRTLDSQPANKKYKIAGETLYIYAPLANRLGLYKIKTELENLSFRFEHPEEYESIVQKLNLTQEERTQLFDQFTEPIRKILDKKGIKYQIKARVKTPYSIWSKMQRKNVGFDEIYDILAVRIVFTPQKPEEEINECFQIYVALRELYEYHRDRTRDWLTSPKANGYQALHVTLMSKQGQWIEVQIRSNRMDEIAEQGFAAHWKYKDGDENPREEGELNDWLRTIKEILDDPQPNAMDFLDSVKLNLFTNEILVFTPKGEIKTLPSGSTALDFAFHIHTFLGTHCFGAKVNHKLVPLNHKLSSGDQIEIITSRTQHVEPSWMKFVTTAKAKAKITAILRRNDREIQKQGENILYQWAKENNLELTMSAIDKLCEFHDLQKHESLLQAIGEKNITLGQEDLDEIYGKKKKSRNGWKKYVPFMKVRDDENQRNAVKVNNELLVVDKDFNKKIPCVITEETINMYIFPKCCNPIPGDDILGFIDDNKHVEIHMRACEVADKLKSSYGNRILDAKWEMHNKNFFEAAIEIHGIDRKGMLHDLADVISDQLGINIHKITIEAHDGVFDGNIELAVHDRSELATIMNQLKTIDGIQEVQQIK